MESFHEKCCTATVENGLWNRLKMEQILQVVDLLAKIHAHSLKGTKWVDNFMNTRSYFDQAWPALAPLLQRVIVPLDPEYFGEKLEKYAYIFEKEYCYQRMMKLHEKMGLPPVLVHGDMWVSNILWERLPNRKAWHHLLAFVDWQISHVGNCCEDIARLLVNSLNGEIRHAKTDEILSEYHAKLTK